MNPQPVRAQAAARTSAMRSAWSRPSSWQGPAIKVRGRAFETSRAPIRTVLASVMPVLPQVPFRCHRGAKGVHIAAKLGLAHALSLHKPCIKRNYDSARIVAREEKLLQAGAAPELEALVAAIRGCRVCAERFAATRTGHAPRPVAWLSATAPIVIAGQAPGARAHASGLPFDDASGDRLRDWLGVDRAAFDDRARFAVLPMAFCFPGYDAKGSDLPPPAICARAWRERALAAMPAARLTLLIGGYAQRWRLGRTGTVADTVRNWRGFGPAVLPLPHPSWRNRGWLRRNPWFEEELVLDLRARVSNLLGGV